ncbi:MAG: NAD(P)H-dependent dehydrogenase/reductase [Desulfobacteraceae bacterium]|nr:NAD(P)H-dependent dehydrogenase/reductase [Desulfobacteraceae bacterium]
MFFELIQKRRSIRKYKKRKVEKEKVDKLVEAALRSPSSRRFNPWRFIVIDNPDILQRLSTLKPYGSSFLANAPLGIVVCADSQKTDVWVEDASIASIFIHLAAQSLDLGSCWIQIRKREHTSSKSSDTYVKEVLNIPDKIMIESIVAIGYPDEEKKGHSNESLQFHKVSFNRYDEKG